MSVFGLPFRGVMSMLCRGGHPSVGGMYMLCNVSASLCSSSCVVCISVVGSGRNCLMVFVVFVNGISSLMRVIRPPPPSSAGRSVLIVEYLGNLGVLWICVNLDSCISAMCILLSRRNCFSSVSLLFMPFMLICRILSLCSGLSLLSLSGKFGFCGVGGLGCGFVGVFVCLGGVCGVGGECLGHRHTGGIFCIFVFAHFKDQWVHAPQSAHWRAYWFLRRG